MQVEQELVWPKESSKEVVFEFWHVYVTQTPYGLARPPGLGSLSGAKLALGSPLDPLLCSQVPFVPL
jgi:hypothetical protein